MGDRTCSVFDCDEVIRARGLCNRHYLREIRNGDPLALRGRPRGQHVANWVGDDAGYHAVHDRLSRARGRAKDQSCVHCGGQAREWAYDHTDPDERTEQLPGGSVCAYSLDLARYIPLCMKCHERLDVDHDFANRTRCSQGHDIRHTVVIGRSRRHRCRKCHAEREATRKANRLRVDKGC